MNRPKLEDFYDESDPRGCSSIDYNKWIDAVRKREKNNGSTRVVEQLPEKGIVSMNGFRYWYKHIVASKGDMCLSTKNPNKYCNGYHAYSHKDPSNGKCFVITQTDDPVVYSTEPVIVEEAQRVDSVVMNEGFDKPKGSFGTSNDPALIEKWRPMLEAQGITDPYKLAWLAEYCENHIEVDRENLNNGDKIIGDEIGELLGIEEGDNESMNKVQESLMFTEPESTPILETERDAEVFFDTIENPKEPNKKLKKAAIEYKETTKTEPTKKLGFFKCIINWFKS